jgi:protein gp37
MAETKIQWAHYTFNPWRGCAKVSPGCAHCYAEAQSVRNPKVLGVWGPGGTRPVAAESYWRQPLKWDREAAAAGERRRVFCASLADVFEDRPELVAPRDRLFDLIDHTPSLDWLLLTKRPENVLRMWPQKDSADIIYEQQRHGTPPLAHFYRPNVWLGVSVEDQQRADERIPLLLQTPAAVRFLSVEPLLGPVNVQHACKNLCPQCRGAGEVIDSEEGGIICGCPCERLVGLHWIICGGESGPHARPCHLEWVRSLVQQCRAAGVACFTKQLGSNPVRDGRTPGSLVGIGPHDEEGFPHCWRCGHFDFGPCADGTLLCNGCNAVWNRLRDPKGGDPLEWPEALRVRKFPATPRSNP